MELGRVGPATGPADERGHDLVEPHVVELAGRLVAAGQLDHVADQGGELVELRDDVVAQGVELLARELVDVLEHLHVGAQARDRRAQLVARVGHQLALGGHRPLERVEGGVEAVGQPGELVAPDDVDPLREVELLGQVLGAAGEAGDRCERGPRHQQPERRGQRDARCAHQDQDDEHPVELAVDLVQRPRHLDRALAADPGREHQQVLAVDVGVGDVVTLAGAGDLACPVGHRQGVRLAARAPTPRPAA